VIQATEAIKMLLGIGEPLIGRLLTYDALGMRFREVKLRRDPKCPLCGEHPTITDLSIHRGAADACEVSDNGHAAPAGVPAATPRGSYPRARSSKWRAAGAHAARILIGATPGSCSRRRVRPSARSSHTTRG
jgi:hypothetical protein